MISQETREFRERMALLWRAYFETRGRETRDELIESYLFLVRDTARRAHARLGGHVSQDDLESAGMLGLMDAVDAYDPGRGIAFETFGVFRIRGAMLDEVRALDWIPRSVRTAERQLIDGRAAATQALGREATSAEVAEHLSMSLDDVLRMDRATRATRVISLSALASAWDEESNQDGEVLPAREEPDHAAMEFREEFCRTFLRQLGRSEQLVVKLYYVEGLTFREIGRSVGLSEGRVSQIHSRALIRLRELAGVSPADHASARRGNRCGDEGTAGTAPSALAA